MITVNQLCMEFGEQRLFDNMTFEIQDGDRVGLIGVNGCGKSTLFKLLTGEYEPTAGDIILHKNTRIGYMEQHVCRNLSVSAYEEVLTVFQDLIEAEQELEQLNAAIAAKTGDVNQLVERQAFLHEMFTRREGLTYRARARSALLGLGFDDEHIHLPIRSLSGGQRAKLQLAKLLLCDANLLLLDEPTNHLDTHAVEWLEEYLMNCRCSFIVISHDRYFLDKVTNRTFELENKKMTPYKGNYTAYLPQRAERRLTAQRVYDNTVREISRLEGIVEQQRRWNREKNIRTAESKQKVIDRLTENLERPEHLPESMTFRLGINNQSGEDVLEVSDVALSFGEKTLFRHVNMEIHRGEKIFLLGPNGCGKTSLVKTLLGQYQADSGRIRYGVGVKKGYYDQIQTGMDSSKTIFEEISDSFPSMTNTEIRSTLARLLFKNDDVFKPLSTLSGGERAKVLLTELMLSKANFLLLDEPTNHLDINSCEALQQALTEYEGTLLVVSHDRYLINHLADKIFYLTAEGIQVYEGNYEDFLKKFQPFAAAPKTAVQTPAAEKQADYKNKKERDALRRKHKARITKLEQEIAETEDTLTALNASLSEPENACSYEKTLSLTEEIDRTQHHLDTLYEEWESISLLLDELSDT
ncbi:MAG: ABC-F family ATP-binding cassette domain-containing protein [Acutalibacteraceae bacterium]|nr:ABC-F family ATP-binding cassette domain-containing protein [Acutalibacteraceae bacterium]